MEPRKLWAEALRSGQFKQGQNVLRRDDRFCCLGVGCEVYQQHVGGLTVRAQETQDGCYDYNGKAAYLPLEVAEWFNITISGRLTNTVEPESLTSCNDRLEMSFTDIADIIESDNLVPFDQQQFDFNGHATS